MSGTIYKITSPSNKIYIGQTIHLYKRINRYKNKLCKSQIKLYNSLCKYKFDNHKFEIIKENISLEDLDTLENYYIELYDCVNTGLNCSKFASVPMRDRHHSQETKDKIRNSNEGQKRSKDSKRKMANAKIGKPGNNTGKTMTLETKNKIQGTRKLRKHNYKGRKLYIEQVREIKILLRDDVLLQKEIALLYKVTPENISSIKNNISWKNVLI